TVDRGSARLQVESRHDDGRPTWRVEADVADLLVRDGDRVLSLETPTDASGKPSGLSLRANYVPDDHRIHLDSVVVGTRYATLDASGQISDLDATRRVDVLGTLTPDWPAI